MLVFQDIAHWIMRVISVRWDRNKVRLRRTSFLSCERFQAVAQSQESQEDPGGHPEVNRQSCECRWTKVAGV